MEKLGLLLVLSLALIHSLPDFALENSQKGPLISEQSPKKGKEADDLVRLVSSLSPAMLYHPLVNIDLFVEGRFAYSSPLQDSTDQKDEETELDLKRGYLALEEFLNPFSRKFP